MKTRFLMVLSIIAVSANVMAGEIVSSLANGKKVECNAIHNIGNDGRGYTQEKMDVFYRKDHPKLKPHAYFKKTVQLGDYRFDGSCGDEVCGLSIRDIRTNTVSTMNAAYAKLNQNEAQIQIMNFDENLTLTLKCKLILPNKKAL